MRGTTDLLRIAHETYHVSLELKDKYGRTLLHFAAISGSLETFEFLLDKGLDIRATDNAGAGMLHYAAMGGSVEMIDFVIGQGFTISFEETMWSPLHWASRTGKPEAMERLIEGGLRSTNVTTTQPEESWSPSSIAILHEKESKAEESIEALGLELKAKKREKAYFK